MMKGYDEATAFLGEWRRFQQLMFFLLTAAMVPNGLIMFAVVFAADIPEHRCLVPEVNLSQEWRDAIIPAEMVNGMEVLSSCSRYRLDLVRNLSAQGLVPSRDVNLTELPQESCLNGWSYSKDIYQTTLVTQFDLVCNDSWKQPFTSMIFFFGIFFGAFVSGQLSDRFGRKPVMFASGALQSLSTFAQPFSTSWPLFCVLYFTTGLGRFSFYLSTFVLGSEILSGKVRVMFSSLGVCVGFAIGYMSLPLFAYFLRDWKQLLFGLSLTCLIYVPLWWLIPESPRWLLSKGRVKEAEAIVTKAARMNQVEAPEEIFKDCLQPVGEKGASSEKHYSFLDLLKTSDIRIISGVICLTWFTLSTSYYGLSLNSSQLHPNPFISSFLSAAVEIPAYLIIWVALRFVRRKVCLLTILLLAAASLLFIPLVPRGLPNLTMTLGVIGKGVITAGTSMIYVLLAELYPTVLRNTASGTCSLPARLGGTTSSFFFQLDLYVKHLPYIILGSLSVISAAAVVILPETFGKDLPQTIEQTPKVKRIPCRRRRRRVVVVVESKL